MKMRQIIYSTGYRLTKLVRLFVHIQAPGWDKQSFFDLVLQSSYAFVRPLRYTTPQNFSASFICGKVIATALSSSVVVIELDVVPIYLSTRYHLRTNSATA